MPTQEKLIKACPVCEEKNPDAFRIYFDGYIKLYRCLTCNHVTQFSGPGGNTIVERYDDYYDLEFVKKGWEFMYPYRQNVLTDIAKRVKAAVGAGKKVLDVGCGDGHFLYRCEELGLETTGIEPSKELSSFAKKKINGEIIKGYYNRDMFPPKSFDAITFIQVVEHLPDPVAILETARYHLKPGGVVVIEVPSRYAPHFLAYQLTGIKWFVKPPDGVIDCHISYFTPSSMRQLTARAGFKEHQLVTGRWKVKYSGLLKLVAALLDPIMQATGIGGILYIGKKN